MAEKTYEIKPVREEDFEATMELIRRTFFIDEPMNQAVGLCVDGACDELDDYCAHALHAGLSFKAVDKEGNIVGAMVNDISPMKEKEGLAMGSPLSPLMADIFMDNFERKYVDSSNGNDYFSMAQRCKNQKFQKILYVLAKREEGAKIWEQFPNENQFMDVKVAATCPNWRKRGIMNELVKATEELTAKKGVRLLRMDTSSAYSAMVAERLGFKCIHSAPYLDIKMDGRPILVPETPHVDDRVYVKIMNV